MFVMIGFEIEKILISSYSPLTPPRLEIFYQLKLIYWSAFFQNSIILFLWI